MKKTLLSTLLAAASIAMLAPAAHAADGTITFNGSVVGTTCTINSGTPNFSVTLPPVSTSALATAGATAGLTPFSIALTACSGGTGNATAYLEPGPTVDTATGQLIVAAGGATNVEIGLLNSKNQPIVAGAATGSQNTDLVSIASGSATLNMYAQYVAMGAATAGAANSTIQYTISYQ
ncbi:Major fimbrial subunit SMF-1 [Paraburkholderia nemoris]|uniref:fimbrial protein n=1 Tax=Paraburkholderia nemoris TaxID=2793076 RepID=UPI00190AA2AB|nr:MULTISPECIES: fimbrial protein [Paraburkholderia]MBK3787247.1 type 1 fimbrial protein [Paraburkholderia aspalathi]CAE6868896.1 Major fimbrial subunit SMF-1 [Paraburkholderia nemoris]